MATHYCYGAPCTEVSEHPSLPLDMRRQCSHVLCLPNIRMFSFRAINFPILCADVLARPSPNMIVQEAMIPLRKIAATDLLILLLRVVSR